MFQLAGPTGGSPASVTLAQKGLARFRVSYCRPAVCRESEMREDEAVEQTAGCITGAVMAYLVRRAA